ncbi:MAG: hypothetical protein JOZ09_06810 [Pseudonocardiales bacterium]|nr:hypothetical protein [Pseudonocardiales bacterium]
MTMHRGAHNRVFSGGRRADNGRLPRWRWSAGCGRAGKTSYDKIGTRGVTERDGRLIDRPTTQPQS